jgi:hypothetical protein
MPHSSEKYLIETIYPESNFKCTIWFTYENFIPALWNIEGGVTLKLHYLSCPSLSLTERGEVRDNLCPVALFSLCFPCTLTISMTHWHERRERDKWEAFLLLLEWKRRLRCTEFFLNWHWLYKTNLSMWPNSYPEDSSVFLEAFRLYPHFLPLVHSFFFLLLLSMLCLCLSQYCNR